MGKRSNFPRRARDDYPTPANVIRPLLSFLDRDWMIIDPCSSSPHALAIKLQDWGFDADPFGLPIDARTARYWADVFVTNPPWRKDLLEPIIENLSEQAPTWLLMSADWLHTKQSIRFLPRLRRVVSVGRVKWIPDSKYGSLDNVVWCLFGREHKDGVFFHGRT